jgi:hypothetical protein
MVANSCALFAGVASFCPEIQKSLKRLSERSRGYAWHYASGIVVTVPLDGHVAQ